MIYSALFILNAIFSGKGIPSAFFMWEVEWDISQNEEYKGYHTDDLIFDIRYIWNIKLICLKNSRNSAHSLYWASNISEINRRWYRIPIKESYNNNILKNIKLTF